MLFSRKSRFSKYVPGATRTVSLSAAISMPAWIVGCYSGILIIAACAEKTDNRKTAATVALIVLLNLADLITTSLSGVVKLNLADHNIGGLGRKRKGSSVLFSPCIYASVMNILYLFVAVLFFFSCLLTTEFCPCFSLIVQIHGQPRRLFLIERTKNPLCG